MIEIVKVTQVRPRGEFTLEITFSTGQVGVRDFSDLVAETGVMVAPLRDPTFFARVFVQNGVPAWPNGFDLDAIALHQEMAAAGLLAQAAIV